MSITLPTKRFTKGDFLFYLVMGLIAFFIYAKGCSNQVPKEESEFDFTRAARAGTGYWTDDTAVNENGTIVVTNVKFVDTSRKPINQLYLRKIDTLDMVVGNYLGRSMTVDQADQIKQIFFRITMELRTDTTHGK